jgi:hypothetical protein
LAIPRLPATSALALPSLAAKQCREVAASIWLRVTTNICPELAAQFMTCGLVVRGLVPDPLSRGRLMQFEPLPKAFWQSVTPLAAQLTGFPLQSSLMVLKQYFNLSVKVCGLPLSNAVAA